MKLPLVEELGEVLRRNLFNLVFFFWLIILIFNHFFLETLTFSQLFLEYLTIRQQCKCEFLKYYDNQVFRFYRFFSFPFMLISIIAFNLCILKNLFWPHLQHVVVPEPGVKPGPKLQPVPLLQQGQILLNVLCHSGTIQTGLIFVAQPSHCETPLSKGEEESMTSPRSSFSLSQLSHQLSLARTSHLAPSNWNGIGRVVFSMLQ